MGPAFTWQHFGNLQFKQQLQSNLVMMGAYTSDYCNRAKAVDPSSAAKASRQAAAYAAHFYPKSEAFFAGIKAGQVVSVAGETTTLRLR